MNQDRCSERIQRCAPRRRFSARLLLDEGWVHGDGHDKQGGMDATPLFAGPPYTGWKKETAMKEETKFSLLFSAIMLGALGLLALTVPM